MPSLSEILQSANDLLQQGDKNGATALFERLLAASPGEPLALEYLGVIASKTGDHERAITLYRQAINHPRCRPSIHFQLGHALRDNGEQEEAVKSYQRYLEHQKDPEGAVSLADVYFNQEKFAESKVYLRLALGWRADHVKALCLLAKTQEITGEHEEAQQLWQRTLEAPGTEDETLLLKACAALDLGHIDQAFSIASTVINALQSKTFKAVVGRFDINKSIKELPEVIGSPTGNSEKPLLIAVADTVYAERFASDLVHSVAKNSPSVNIHIHIIAPDPIQGDFLLGHNLPAHSISWEVDTKASRVTFASRRFVRLAQWRHVIHQPLILTDIDSIVNKNIGDALVALPDFDVAMRYRKEEVFIHQRVAAGFLALAPSVESKTFIDSVAAYIRYFEVEGSAAWFVDQMALLTARLRAQDFDSQIRITDIPAEYLDWNGQTADSLVWTAKGPRKSSLKKGRPGDG